MTSSGRSKSSTSSDSEARARTRKGTCQLYDLSRNRIVERKADLSCGAKEDRATTTILIPDYFLAKDRINIEDDDDSSAGSSGWESSDGDSSSQTVDWAAVDTSDTILASVSERDHHNASATRIKSAGLSRKSGCVFDYFQANLFEPFDSNIKYDRTYAYSESEEETENCDLQSESFNQAGNSVVRRGVTMIPVDGCDDEDSSSMPGNSDSPILMLRDLERAIEVADWAAVCVTAANLASDSERDHDHESVTRSAGLSKKSGSASASAETGGSNGSKENTSRASTWLLDEVPSSKSHTDYSEAIDARCIDKARCFHKFLRLLNPPKTSTRFKSKKYKSLP